MDDRYFEDPEIENYLADIEDVMSGKTVDMPHAQMMYKVMDALDDLSNSIEQIERDEKAYYAAINARTIEELNHMIEKINLMREQIDSYFGADEEDDEPED